MADAVTGTSRKLVVLLCEKYSGWSKEDNLFPDLVNLEAEVAIHLCYEGDFPPLDESSFEHAWGYVISGSAKGAYETDEWILDMLDWIRRYTALAKRSAAPPKLIGVCFGAQAIGQALGGRVGENATNGSFMFGVETLALTEEFLCLPFVRAAVEETSWDTKGGLQVYECHGDAVNVLPERATVYASSESTAVEIFGIGGKWPRYHISIGDILAIQGHPELSRLHMAALLPKMEQNGFVSSEQVPTKLLELESRSTDGKFVGAVFRHFLMS